MTTSETLTISEAAAACGVARSTVVRALDAGRLPNAAKVAAPGGPRWAIPVTDLEAAGYSVDRGRASDTAGEKAEGGAVGQALERVYGDLLPLLERVTNAEREAAEVRARLEVEGERHARALERVERDLERARASGSRSDLATYGGLAAVAYAGLLALAEVPLAVRAGVPAAAGALLIAWAAWTARRSR